ncbi:MAG: hypothetical protein KDD19_15855 [Phaeodactylibacter sp.]|nr:hypothetical protein [Phaeodactylibacter sp.]MCB9050935.1 hypothetical protein [Lewinellaceae bacterium]
MAEKTLNDFHRDLSWSTRIYTLLTIVIAVGAFLFDAWNTNWAVTMVVALAAVLFVESFALYFQHHPRVWRLVRWGLLLLLLLLLLTGFLWLSYF